MIIAVGKTDGLFWLSLWVLSGPEDPWPHPPKGSESILHGVGETYI